MQLEDLPTGDPGAITLAMQFLLKAQNDGESRVKINMLIRWITEAQDLDGLAQPPAPPPGPPGAGAPPGAPPGPGPNVAGAPPSAVMNAATATPMAA